jgi:hypothetical protein
VTDGVDFGTRQLGAVGSTQLPKTLAEIVAPARAALSLSRTANRMPPPTISECDINVR